MTSIILFKTSMCPACRQIEAMCEGKRTIEKIYIDTPDGLADATAEYQMFERQAPALMIDGVLHPASEITDNGVLKEQHVKDLLRI